MGLPLGPVTSFPYPSPIGTCSFTIANIPMPGKWTLIEAKKKFGWQILAGFALAGATVIPKGDELVTAKFKGEIWDNGDMFAYKQARQRLFQKGVLTLPGGALGATAMGISHPELKAMGVESVVTLEIGALIQEEGGLWVTHIDFLQYRRPVPVPPKPQRTTPDIAPPVPTAKNAQELEAQKIKAEVTSKMAILTGPVR